MTNSIYDRSNDWLHHRPHHWLHYRPPDPVIDSMTALITGPMTNALLKSNTMAYIDHELFIVISGQFRTLALFKLEEKMMNM